MYDALINESKRWGFFLVEFLGGYVTEKCPECGRNALLFSSVERTLFLCNCGYRRVLQSDNGHDPIEALRKDQENRAVSQEEFLEFVADNTEAV